jgi:hypothetical protein
VSLVSSHVNANLLTSLQVWKHIFTGPTSALQTQPSRSRTKKGRAGLNRLERVTPRTIAYAAIHMSYDISYVFHHCLIYYYRLVGFYALKMTGGQVMPFSIYASFSILLSTSSKWIPMMNGVLIHWRGGIGGWLLFPLQFPTENIIR